MRLGAVLLGILTFFLVNATAHAQIVADSSATPADVTFKRSTKDEPLNKTGKEKGLSKPGRAALYSAIIPGAGQVYNKDYWKVPIVYAALGTLGYFIIYNNNLYQDYRQAYIFAVDGNPNTNNSLSLTYTGTAGENYLRTSRDFYHRNRDLSVMLTILAYGLNIVEANVAAHLSTFDISDDLSLNWKPSLQYQPFGASPVPGLTFNLHLKH